VIFKFCETRDQPLEHLSRQNSENECKLNTDRENAKLAMSHQNNYVIPIVSVAR